jgi:hypothetical protein
VAELIADVIVYFAVGYYGWQYRQRVPEYFRIAKKKWRARK